MRRFVVFTFMWAFAATVLAGGTLSQRRSELVEIRQGTESHPLADELSAKAAVEQGNMCLLDLAQHYQDEIKQLRIEQLERQNERQKAELRQRELQQRWLWTVAVGSLIMLAGNAFFLGRSRRAQQHLRLLNAQLDEAKSQLQATLDAIPDPMFELGLDGRYYDCHVPRSEVTIVDRNTLLGKTVGEVMPAEAATVCLMALSEAYSRGVSFGKQVKMPLAMGEGWFELSVAAKPALAGEAPRFIVISRDITGRKRAEDALAAREREFRILAQTLPDNIVRYDSEGRTLYINPVMEKTLGLTREQILGTTIRELFPGGAFEDYAQVVDRALALGEYGELELHVPGEAGRIHQIRVVAERDDAGAVVGALAIGRDITDRKRSEISLQDSEQRYREIFENVSDALYLVEVMPDGGFVNRAFNFAFEMVTGLAREDLIGRPADARDVGSVGEACFNIDIAKLKHCVEVDMPIEEEIVLDLPTGRRTFYSTLIPLHDSDCRIYRILGVARDVTEIIGAERNFRTLAENAPDNICRYDLDCRIMYLNPRMAHTLGVSALAALGKTPSELFPDGRYAAYQAKVAQVAATGMADEIQLQQADDTGGLYYFQFSFVAERDAGKLVGVLAIGHDITEHKRAAAQIQALNLSLEQRVQDRTEALRQQTRYLRTIIDSLPLLIWLKDTESRFVMVNQATAASCRLGVDEMVGKCDADLWPATLAETYIAEDREVMATRQRKIVEEILPHSDGSAWIEIDKVPVLDEDGSVLGTVGVVRNISERKALDAAREKALAEAVRLVRLRSEFMARMSHELRTPLNGILGYAQLLARDEGLSPKQREMLSVIQQSGEHLLTLINDILDFAKIEAGKQTLNPKAIFLPDFLKNLAGIVRVWGQQKGLDLICDFAADIPAVIHADETRLRQVLLNLLGNAFKYSEHGQIRFGVFSPRAGQLHFEIRDSGIGIEAGHLERIFQPFEQAGDGQYSNSGTGLGLAISRELVRLMGGDIRVSSRLGQGSTFEFDLELESLSHGQEGLDDQGLPIGMPERRGRILLVAACEDRRDLLADMLHRQGLETRLAANAAECLDMIEQAMPDLILVDAAATRTIGLEIVEPVRTLQQTARTPIIALTAGG
ncbi:MAG: PAS domain-containing protein, partial [Methylomonas sp.]|nr:PAS domain-containing protein [Methylomonas sp.]